MRSLSIGLVYETFETYPRHPEHPADSHVEFEPESTIEALEAGIVYLGHRPVRLGSPLELRARLEALPSPGVDAVLNVAEGFGSRNREAWAPVLLEMAGVPTLGSDALTLSLTLDKAWANRWARAGGIPVAPQTTMAAPEDAEQGELPAPFPLFVKPRWEGTAKGIRRSSRVSSRAELAVEVARIVRDYAQPALVEAFVPGAEYTVTLVGNDPPQVLPALQRAIERESGIGLHALEGPGRMEDAVALEPITPGVLDAALEGELAERARHAFALFECRDFARVDFRLDAAGTPIFLEINPLPTFATDGSFAILAELESCSLSEMLGRCVSAGLVRLGLEEASRETAAGNGPDGDEEEVGGSMTRTMESKTAILEGDGEGQGEGEGAASLRGNGNSLRPSWPLRASAPPDGVSIRDWSDWGWQMRHRIRTAASLREWIEPTQDEEAAIEALATRFRFVITPYYASLMDPANPDCPVRRQVVPRLAELADEAGLADPLDEVAHSPVKNVIRVYPDRIAFCVNNECALYCRYCLRKRMVGDEGWAMQKRELETALDWIASTPEIRDVLLTGGDPLVFSDARLEWLLARLRAIPHVELIRLGTRLPVTLPFRVTDALCDMLERYHPIWLNTHFNHPRELTAEAAAACDRLLRAGIPVGNQSVLLRGVNDSPATMKALCETLVRMRVRPYYVYQAQLLEGTEHFRVPIEEGIELFRGMRGRTSGFAIPQYVLDTPHGKVPLDHPFARGREGDDFVVEAWDGEIWREPNPLPATSPAKSRI